MGVSSDAILLYGYIWTDEMQIPAALDPEGENNWVTTVLDFRGIRSPWDEYTEIVGSHETREQHLQAFKDSHQFTIDAWREARLSVEKEYSIIVDTHQHIDCAMPYVAAYALTANRGTPERVLSLAVDPSWDAQLDRFMTELRIPKPHAAPQWWLASYMG